MAQPSDLSPEEDEIFRLFRLLRESTARVSDAFVRRVSTRLAALIDEERLRHPSLLEVVDRLSVDSLNILSRTARSTGLTGATGPLKEDDDGSDDDH